MRRGSTPWLGAITLGLLPLFGCDDAGSTDEVADAGPVAMDMSSADASEGAPDATLMVEDAGTDMALEPDMGEVAAPDMGPPPMRGWSTAAELPGPRQETAVVALDGEIFVIGGFDGRLRIVGTVEAYDPVGDTWRAVADLPVALHHANAAVHDGKIYVLGFLGRGFAADGRGYVYDPAQDTWSPVAPMPDTEARGASGTVAIGDRIYVIGGLDGAQAVTLSTAYDPTTDTWGPMADIPSPRDHMVATAVNGEVIVIGGRNTRIEAHTPQVDIYNPESDTWRTGSPAEVSRGGMMGAAIDNRVYVFGGEGNEGDATGVFAATEVYDVEADSWETLAPMPAPRHGTGAAAIDGRIIIPGGADVQAFGAVDTVEIYTP
ncbi:MAG: Kelch repeat-containing protein [Bradymonadia bacterium]